MARLSISTAWEETRSVITRELRLLTALALALSVLPGTVSMLVEPQVTPGELPPAGPWLAVFLLAILIGLACQLAIIRLVLGSGVSVAEAIRHGFARLPSFLGAILTVVVPLFVILILLSGVVGTDPANANPVAAIALLLLLPAVVYVLIRLMLMAPVASTERVGPIAIVQRSWALSRGNWWRLFAFFLLIAIAAVVVIMASAIVIGSLIKLIFGDPEPMSVGMLFSAFATQAIATSANVVLIVMLARMYAQLVGPGHATVSVPRS